MEFPANADGFHAGYTENQDSRKALDLALLAYFQCVACGTLYGGDYPTVIKVARENEYHIQASTLDEEKMERGRHKPKCGGFSSPKMLTNVTTVFDISELPDNSRVVNGVVIIPKFIWESHRLKRIYRGLEEPTKKTWRWGER